MGNPEASEPAPVANPGPQARRRVPILTSLQGYQSSWLSGDIIAGLTLLAIAIPEQMATAKLGNMPVITGLYAFVAGSLLIALLGAAGTMSVGADSTIAPVFAAGVATVATAGSPAYSHLVALLALVVGFVLVVVGLLRLGWIAEFISTPVVTGILAGIAIEIAVHQLPSVLGIKGGGISTLQRLDNVAHQLSGTNQWTLGLSAGVLVLIVVAEKVNRRIPGALLGLVASVIAVGALGLKAHGVHVLGTVPGGFPHLGLPSVAGKDLPALASTAATVAFLCVIQTAATSRSSPGDPDRDADRDLDRDLIGLGAGGLLAGMVGAFPIDSSPPRSTVVAAAGGRTQLTSLIAAAGVVGAVAFAGGFLARIPQATLGAILVYVATRLFHTKDLRAILAYDRFEFLLALITMLAVAIFGIETGVLVALVLSLGDRTRMTARPKAAVLARVCGSDHWVIPDPRLTTEQVPGVMVYLLMAPLWFGNAQHVAQRIRAALTCSAGPVKVFILNAAGVSDIDYTGYQAMDSLIKSLEASGVVVGVARPSGEVLDDLKRSTLMRRIGRNYIFDDVEAAVQALSAPGPAPK